MFVAVAELDLRIPDNRSLKGKRRLLTRVIDRARDRFNLAVAEVGAQDIHQRAIIGAAMVGGDRRQLERALDRWIRWFESETAGTAEVVSLDIEIL